METPFFRLGVDNSGQFKIDWSQAGGGKRAWVQRNRTRERNWANAERYLQLVRLNDDGRPGGNPTDFPIYRNSTELSDQELLISFVTGVCVATGVPVPPFSKWEIDPSWEKTNG